MSEVHHAAGLVPIAWLVVLRLVWQRRDASLWLMALAFSISFVADSASHAYDPGLISQVYLVLQGGLFAFAIAPHRIADRCVPALLAVAGASVALRRGEGLDWMLHLTAFLGIAWLSWRYVPRGTLRHVMVGGFAALAVTWMWFVADPSFDRIQLYQAARLLLAAMWCVAATLRPSCGQVA